MAGKRASTTTAIFITRITKHEKPGDQHPQFDGENVKYSKPDAGSSNSGYKSAAAGVAAGQHQTPGNAAAGLEQILYAVADSTQVLL